jgi:benzoyl-CoA reductase/2-hydroxyglutaryl-CoA dehydratase subunit BcrC/BadD/HgdB
MPNSTNTQLSIVDELKSQLTDIKDKIKESSTSGSSFDILTSGAKILQDKIDYFLKNKGFYTQSDVNDAYATMQEVQRKQLEADTKKAKNRAILYTGLVLAGIIGLYLLLRQKNKG